MIFKKWYKAKRSYVKTSDNKDLQEAIDLVLNKSVPVNTASRIKRVPRTTLRKALEKICMKGKIATKTYEKKKRYQLDGVNLTAESQSRADDTDIDPELDDTVRPTMVKSKF